MFKCDDFHGMTVKSEISLSGATVFAVCKGEQPLSDPFAKRDDAIAFLFRMKTKRDSE